MKYWLMKSEPEAFSIDALANAKQQTTFWDGVRNYQARNMLRDDVAVGDQVFFYHSNCKIPGIVGIAKVVKSGYPDVTQFNPTSKYYDSTSTPDKPRWFGVDITLVKKFKAVVALEEIKQHPLLQKMKLVQKGNRLSVTPVSKEEWQVIVAMSK